MLILRATLVSVNYFGASRLQRQPQERAWFARVRDVSEMQGKGLWTRLRHGVARAAQCPCFAFYNKIDLVAFYVAVPAPRKRLVSPEIIPVDQGDHAQGWVFAMKR